MATSVYNEGKQVWSGTDESPVETFSVDTERRDLDVSSEILELQPDETPFLVISDRASSATATSTEVTWFDDDLASWWTYLTSDYVASSTGDVENISVNDSSIVKKKDLIKNAATGEVMFVNSIVDSSTIEVIRGYGDETNSGGTGAVASSSTDDNLMRMGNAMEENSLSPDPRATQPDKYYNYVQVFRTPFSGSWENLNEDKKTNEDERTRLRRRKAIEHNLDKERALLWGERNEKVGDSRRLLGGLFQFLTNQETDIGGNLTESAFEDALEPAFKYGSSEKVLITSPAVGSEINSFAKDNIQTRSKEETYGLKINEYLSFHGRLYIATSHMFEKDYEGMGVIVDVENINLLPYAGMNTTLRTNLQENDRLGWKDEYLTAMTLEVRLEKTHRVLTGITFA